MPNTLALALGGDDDLKNMAKAKMRETAVHSCPGLMSKEADVDRPTASTSVLRPNASVVHFKEHSVERSGIRLRDLDLSEMLKRTGVR